MGGCFPLESWKQAVAFLWIPTAFYPLQFILTTVHFNWLTLLLGPELFLLSPPAHKVPVFCCCFLFSKCIQETLASFPHVWGYFFYSLCNGCYILFDRHLLPPPTGVDWEYFFLLCFHLHLNAQYLEHKEIWLLCWTIFLSLFSVRDFS